MSTCCDGESRYYQGDVGTVILVDTCNDITTATKVSLKVKKPDGTLTEWVGTVSGTTVIRYVVQVDDFSQVGYYRVQSYVEMPGGIWRGDTATFRVTTAFE